MNRIRRTALPLVIAGVLGLVLAACGAGAADGPAAAPSTGPPAPAGPPGTTGTIAAVGASDIEVQNPRTGQHTVTFSGTTTFTRTVAGTAADVVVGDCVAVLAAGAAGGTPAPAAPSGPVTAGSVVISPATAQGCRGGRGPGGGARTGSPPSGTGPGPGNGARDGRGAFGAVVAVTAGGFTVQGAGPSSATTTVTTDAGTTYTRTEPADRSALVVGQCATAVGVVDDTGAVAASSIAVRPPGPNGCTVVGGPGGGRAGRGPAGGSGAGSG